MCVELNNKVMREEWWWSRNIVAVIVDPEARMLGCHCRWDVECVGRSMNVICRIMGGGSVVIVALPLYVKD